MIRRTIALLIVVFLCFAVLTTVAWTADKFTWPIAGEVIKRFDPDEHRGIDIAGSTGASIVAAQDGIVYWIGKTPRGEPCISIDHPGGLTTTYLPVTASVSKGQSVQAGDAIGTLSSEVDKSSSEQHLHFGIFETATRDDKRYLDPSNYLSDISNETEDKHEPAAAIEASSGSNTQKLSEDQGQSTGKVEVQPEITEQPQQRVAISTVNVVDRPAENVKTDPQSPLDIPNTKVEGWVAPGVVANQPNAGLVQQAHTGVGEKLDGSMRGQILASNGVFRDAALKVGLPNLSRVAPEVKPDLISAVNHGTHSINSASAQTSQKPIKTAGECAKPQVSAISGWRPIKGTASSSKACTGKPLVNPFEHLISTKHANSTKRATSVTKGKMQLCSRATKPSHALAQRFLNWQFLPTTTSALALLLIAIISYQCVRTTRRIGPSLSSAVTPSC